MCVRRADQCDQMLEWKVAQFLPKITTFFLEVMFFIIALKVTKYLSYFYRKYVYVKVYVTNTFQE